MLRSLEKKPPPLMASTERGWGDLNKDLLVTIFANLGVEDLIAGIPLVCASWYDAGKDSRCWKNLDFRDWFSISRHLGCLREREVDFPDLLRFTIDRSAASLEALWFPYFAGEADLLYVAERCLALLFFSLENEDVSIDKFCKAIGKLEFLKGMAVDESLICEDVLQHVGRSCAHFFELKVFADGVDEDMARVICKCLPYLRKLELTYCRVSRQALLILLDELKDLEYLDVSGYEVPGITGTVLEKASHLNVFLWDQFDYNEFDCCSEFGQDTI